MKNSVILVAMLVHSSFYGLQKDLSSPPSEPTQAQRDYLKQIVRGTLDPKVRDFMNRYPDDNRVTFLKRYIALLTDRVLQTKDRQPLPRVVNQEGLSSYICKDFLMAMFRVSTIEDLKTRLAAKGLLYDSLQPCNTWQQVLIIVQDEVKKASLFQTTAANWPIKSLEESPYNSGPHLLTTCSSAGFMSNMVGKPST